MTTMIAHLAQVGPMLFEGRAGDAPTIRLHAPPKGERKEGPSPMQAALLAAMGCTASDVAAILGKEREAVTSLEIEADAVRSEEAPKVLTEVHLHFRIRGEGVHEANVKRAIDLSTEKYCSVGIMLRRGGVAWRTSYEILPPA
jgi:putative redox protein